ncbi:flavoprotein [Marinisporobacter balticus]|uniref:Flavoprotein n=1 Tax=Marinisporobacter balticus TaxID=2018667 RepID=A0A4R2KYI2_9FIRM|nr:flavoprotein [Marinisporobacter balticus]TCO77957.1 flavoprotein [Marinisporobacter balticus]
MDIRKIIEETMIEVFTTEIVNEVLRRLENMPKKALVIFTGGSIGFNESIEQIKKLKADGWKLRLLISRSAESVLTKEIIKDRIGSDEVEIHVERDPKEMKFYYSDIDKVIFPVLTMNTATKIAHGISDTLITNIVSQCLMMDIPIVAAKNACDPSNEERIRIGMGKAQTAYINTLNHHLTLLESYGIKLVSGNEIYDEVMKRTKEHTNKKNHHTKEQVMYKKKVLTRAGLVDAVDGNKDLMVSSKTIITEIAKDTARTLGVKIIIQ